MAYSAARTFVGPEYKSELPLMYNLTAHLPVLRVTPNQAFQGVWTPEPIVGIQKWVSPEEFAQSYAGGNMSKSKKPKKLKAKKPTIKALQAKVAGEQRLSAERAKLATDAEASLIAAKRALSGILTGTDPQDSLYFGLSLSKILSWPEIYAKVGALVAQHADDEQRKAYLVQSGELYSLRERNAELERQRCDCKG